MEMTHQVKPELLTSGVPATPSEILSAKISAMPNFVIDCFNTCLVEQYHNGYATIKQDVVEPMITKKCKEFNVPFSLTFLDIEPFYRNKGWNVQYTRKSNGAGRPVGKFEFAAKQPK